MARKWTEEERKKQAEAIRRWKPWEQSTGPKTEDGKNRCKMNAFKSGFYTLEYKILRRALNHQKQFVKGVEIWAAAHNKLEEFRKNIKESDY